LVIIIIFLNIEKNPVKKNKKKKKIKNKNKIKTKRSFDYAEYFSSHVKQ
jgi:hypothetical protein